MKTEPSNTSRPAKQSPVKKGPMDFPTAIRSVMNGLRITKQEWNDYETYGVLKDGLLLLHKPNGDFYSWIINEGDLMGEDWIEIDRSDYHFAP